MKLDHKLLENDAPDPYAPGRQDHSGYIRFVPARLLMMIFRCNGIVNGLIMEIAGNETTEP